MSVKQNLDLIPLPMSESVVKDLNMTRISFLALGQELGIDRAGLMLRG